MTFLRQGANVDDILTNKSGYGYTQNIQINFLRSIKVVNACQFLDGFSQFCSREKDQTKNFMRCIRKFLDNASFLAFKVLML
jgi:hypothetical protein